MIHDLWYRNTISINSFRKLGQNYYTHFNFARTIYLIGIFIRSRKYSPSHSITSFHYYRHCSSTSRSKDPPNRQSFFRCEKVLFISSDPFSPPNENSGPIYYTIQNNFHQFSLIKIREFAYSHTSTR